MATRSLPCRSRRRLARVASAALAGALVTFAVAPAALSADPVDESAPEASDFQIWPGAVNASLTAQALSVWIDLSDEGGGFSDSDGVATVTVQHADGAPVLTATFDAADRVSGSALHGTYETDMSVPAGAPTGTWQVTRVDVHDAAGNSRAYTTSEELAGAILDERFETDTTLRPPAEPEDVAAVAADASASVTWSAPPRDGGSPITSYTVSALTEGDGDVDVTVEAPATTTMVGGLENGRSYTFEVTATNAEGDSEPSDRSDPVVPEAPDLTPPRVTAFDVSPDGVEVSEAAAAVIVTVKVADPESGLGDDSVAVTLRSPSAAQSVAVTLGDDERIAGGDDDATYRSAVTIPHGAEPGRWSAEVKVTDRAGNIADLDAAALGSAGFENGVDVEADGVPGMPGSLSAIPGNATAALTWTAPASDGGRPITSYRLTVMAGSEVVRTVTTAGTATTTTVAGLTNGTAYTFTVAATNELGTGPDSTPTDAAVPATRPDNPGDVAATAGDGNATVTWNAPAFDGGAPVTTYRITIREGGGTSRIVTAAGSATDIRIEGLTNDRTYRFSVAAVNRAGSSAAVLSNAVVPTVSTSSAGTPTTTTTTAPPPAPVRSGYWMLGAEGRVYHFGQAGAYGAPVDHLRRPAVDLEPTASGSGYWVVDDLGNVFGHGDARWFGNVSPSRLAPGETVTSLSRTRTGSGYWLFTTRGRVLPFGDALFYGDLLGMPLNGPVLDSIPTATGRGYYMVASDGGIFSFGDALFRGSMGGKPLNAPVQSLVPDGDGAGYWLVASDGGIFAFDAPFRGSMGGTRLNRPVTGMVRFGNGYLMVGEDGGIFNFSDRPFFGSLGDTTVPRPIVAVAVLED